MEEGAFETKHMGKKKERRQKEGGIGEIIIECREREYSPRVKGAATACHNVYARTVNEGGEIHA